MTLPSTFTPAKYDTCHMAYYSIDVECVATAKTHNARAVAQISLVDGYEAVLLNIYVRPEAPVVNYLTPLTGYESVCTRGSARAHSS